MIIFEGEKMAEASKTISYDDLCDTLTQSKTISHLLLTAGSDLNYAMDTSTSRKWRMRQCTPTVLSLECDHFLFCLDVKDILKIEQQNSSRHKGNVEIEIYLKSGNKLSLEYR